MYSYVQLLEICLMWDWYLSVIWKGAPRAKLNSKTRKEKNESPKANANAGIVINISKNAESDYFIEGEDDEGIADYDDEQDESFYKDDFANL